MCQLTVGVALLGEFVVSPVDGELRVKRDVELDREAVPFYNITIMARDLGTPSLSSTVRNLRNMEFHKYTA